MTDMTIRDLAEWARGADAIVQVQWHRQWVVDVGPVGYVHEENVCVEHDDLVTGLRLAMHEYDARRMRALSQKVNQKMGEADEHHRVGENFEDWSIPSALTNEKLGHFFRLFVTAGSDGFVAITDTQVTSANPGATELEGGTDCSLHLTTDEAVWLLRVLPEAIRAARENRNKGRRMASFQKMGEEDCVVRPSEERFRARR